MADGGKIAELRMQQHICMALLSQQPFAVSFYALSLRCQAPSSPLPAGMFTATAAVASVFTPITRVAKQFGFEIKTIAPATPPAAATGLVKVPSLSGYFVSTVCTLLVGPVTSLFSFASYRIALSVIVSRHDTKSRESQQNVSPDRRPGNQTGRFGDWLDATRLRVANNVRKQQIKPVLTVVPPEWGNDPPHPVELETYLQYRGGWSKGQLRLVKWSVQSCVIAAMTVVAHGPSKLRTWLLVDDAWPVAAGPTLSKAFQWSFRGGCFFIGLPSHIVTSIAAYTLQEYFILPHVRQFFRSVTQNFAGWNTNRKGEPFMPVRMIPFSNWLSSLLVNQFAFVTSTFLVNMILYPLHTVRLRLEYTGSLGTEVSGNYANGSVQCVTKIWKEEGVKGFYRGFSVYSVSIIGQYWFLLAVYGLLDLFYRGDDHDPLVQETTQPEYLMSLDED